MVVSEAEPNGPEPSFPAMTRSIPEVVVAASIVGLAVVGDLKVTSQYNQLQF